MKRMVDNKKLREIEASGGTRFYNHKIISNSGDVLELITLQKDKINEIDNGRYLCFVISAGGPNIPYIDNSFHLLYKNTSASVSIRYINSSNELNTYELSVNSISSEEVTAL